MADNNEKSTGPTKPESPTTARPLDFDDDHEPASAQESGVTQAATPPVGQSTLGSDENAPPKPPRPLSPRQQAQKDLKEAFPSIDDGVIKAVLMASGGNIERAFNALLGMSDPNAQIEEDLPPTMPPRPSMATSTSQRQLEQDELYARQLAEHYSGSSHRRAYPQSGWGDHEPRLPRSQRETGLKPNELHDDRDYSFFDDDLPIIKENIRKGFLETQLKVNSWVQNFKKRLDGEDSEDEYQNTPARPADGYNQGFGEAPSNRARRSAEARRSADRERYDADPQLISDNFSSLELRDNEAPPPRPPRPLANPDLFKTKSPSPDRRKVSFQEGPPEEINDLYSGGAASQSRKSSSTKSSKWQPLSTVEPSPIGDNDPFSLGDTDDEKEAKNKDLKPEEAERVKQATEEAMAGGVGSAAKSDEGAHDKSDNTKGS